MAVVQELIRKEDNRTISFGDYTLATKTKKSDFEFEGDLYKVKTYHEITKLEKNGLFIYESVPGTSVFHFDNKEDQVSFEVYGKEAAQITLELEAAKEYEIFKDEVSLGQMKTNLGGKLVFSVDLGNEAKALIKVVKL